MAKLLILLLLSIQNVYASERQYGPLTIEMNGWTLMNGSMVARARNKSGQDIFIGINCTSRMINTTGKNDQWRVWFDPTLYWEKRMIADICNQP